MIKRSFIGLTEPRLMYDLVEPDPKEPEFIPTPSRIVVLLNEPLDSTRAPLIKPGDTVKAGEKVFLYETSTEYATPPVSGTIRTIASYNGDFGNTATYFVIENDNTDTHTGEFESVAESPDLATADRFLRYLPGAPPFSLLADSDRNIHTIVISGMDEDLMSTTRQYLSVKKADEINRGVQILKQMTGIGKIAITIPEYMGNAPGIEGVVIFPISGVYPSALKATILKDHLGITLPAGKKPEDLGICFMSVEAVIAIAKSYEAKQPVYDKLITLIDKNLIRYRVRATLGTPITKLFEPYNIEVNEEDRVIIGGPMKGFAAYSLYHPVEPGMDTIIIQDKTAIPYVSDYPCVNCGKCVRVCPTNVPVNLLVRFLEANQYEEAADHHDLLSCIECGLCSYVCTARIPIFQYIRLGKHELERIQSAMETEADNA